MNPLLQTYFPLADIIAETFGEFCEVVVHDLSQPESSVVYVANGQVTGRKIGQSFAHLVRQVLLDQIAAFVGNEVPEEESERNLDQDVMAVIDELILKIIGTTDVKNLTRKKSVEIIRFMDEKGIFLVKGAVDKVAALMGVSRVTIYSYLDEAKGKR